MKWLSLLAVLLAACPGNARAEELRAGAAAVIINPPEGTPMAGYYSARGANAVLDNLRRFRYDRCPEVGRPEVRCQFDLT